jgi:hypothetical protein
MFIFRLAVDRDSIVVIKRGATRLDSSKIRAAPGSAVVIPWQFLEECSNWPCGAVTNRKRWLGFANMSGILSYFTRSYMRERPPLAWIRSGRGWIITGNYVANLKKCRVTPVQLFVKKTHDGWMEDGQPTF